MSTSATTNPLPLKLLEAVRRARRKLTSAAWVVLRVLLIGWGVGAIYYSTLPWLGLRVGLAVLFLAGAIRLLFLRPSWRGYLLFAFVYLGLLIAWGRIAAQQERDWSPEVARLSRAEVDGDTVRITNVRNFTYRSATDFDIRYEDREFRLSELTSVDLYVSYWATGPVGHTFVSFRFEHDPPLCISIETRPEVGEGYGPLASIFKQYEIIHVVGDERDIVGVRTHHRGEEVYLYPLKTSAAAARLLFLVYVERLNELADEPEWYHLLKDNCTLNIIQYANAAGREGGFDYRHLLNGWIDRYLYVAGYVDTTLPFGELRSQSCISADKRPATIGPDFSELIRSQLPNGGTAPPVDVPAVSATP